MVEKILTTLQSLPVWSGGTSMQMLGLFLGLLILSQLILLPVWPFVVFAGFQFGFWPGAGLLLGAKMVSALLNFTLSRWVIRDWVQRVAGRQVLFSSMNEALEQDGLRMAILLRFCPVPFALGNYAYGLSVLPLKEFAMATFVTIFPTTLIFAGVGASLRSELDVAQLGGAGGTHNRWETWLLGVGLLASFVVVRRVSKIAMKKVKSRGVVWDKPVDASSHSG